MSRRALCYGAFIAAVVTLMVGVTVLYVIRSNAFANLVDHSQPTGIATADLSGSGPGTLVSATTMPAVSRHLDRGVQAARVVYRSTEGDTGAPTQVSGTVFVPTAAPREGGWPVLAFGHGTTGIDEPCAPSLSPTLWDQTAVINGLVQSGYAIAFPDYQGLGAPGIHPYLDARTAGLNVIDAVRALRATFPNVSRRWAAFGMSQGGAAVWAADEYAAGYAPELELVGVSAIAPPADLTGLVDRAQSGTLTSAQELPFVWLLTSLHRLHPDFNLDDYRRGVLTQHWDALSACSGPEADTWDGIQNDVRPQDLSPGDSAAADRLRGLLQRWALPQRILSAPLLVTYGTEDPYIDSGWTDSAISRACALHGTVVWRLEVGKGHDDVDGVDQLQWLAERFAGKPLVSECR
ncbi:MAG: alpha/beta hydrolase [Mycobacteriaceae bacterium]|nr:alpha/beta hydrolase [Mycobacteriaceae bacterium]